MKHKLFKKFATRDLNDYYFATINGDNYYGVATRYEYDVKFLGMKFHRTEEQAFHTVKVPLVVIMYLTRLLENGENFTFPEARRIMQDSLILELAKGESALIEANPNEKDNIRRSFRKQYENVYAMFENDWNVVDICNGNDWTLIYSEYAGRATRNLWYARKMDELVTIQMIKVFGNSEENEVVDFKRILVDEELIKDYIDNITK